MPFSRGPAKGRSLCYTRRPYGAFLDRLLADDRAGADAPPAAATPAAPAATAPGRAGADPPEALPAVPVGPGAPRIAIYDTLTSPPRVITSRSGDLPALIASLAEKTYHSLPRAGRPGALHGHPGAHREPAARLLPRRRHHHPRQRPDHAHLRPRPRRRRQGPRLPARLHHGDRRAAADHPRRRLRPAHRARVAAASCAACSRWTTTWAAAPCSPSRCRSGAQAQAAPPPQAPSAPKLTTRQTKVLVLLMELGSAGPRPSPRSSASPRRRPSGSFVYWKSWG